MQYCKSKASTNTTGVKYKFGMQIQNWIKDSDNPDKKNGNNLSEEAIEAQLKQLTDYQTFIVLDSGESIPSSHKCW
jgi:hypothetical protein